ncbi:MAG TPA: hypothetical protein VG651_20300 [Stellaceae bacterium]|nr:hypothetical protein [Stellaceae bacterium]
MAKALEDADPAVALQSTAARLREIDTGPFGTWLAMAAVNSALQPLTSVARRESPSIVKERDSLDLRKQEAATF